MAGRKPLPTHLKLVKGTARPHRMNKAEPKPVVAVPGPPDHLDEDARAKFIEMAELLARHGVMTELDTGALGATSSSGDAGSRRKKKSNVVATW